VADSTIDPPEEVTLSVTSPSHQSAVPYSQRVRGVISKPKGRVQVFVLARDGKWYLQHKAAHVGTFYTRFECRVFFGLPSSEPGGDYQIVACSPRQAVTTSAPLAELPEGPKSLPVMVRRTDFDTSQPPGFENPRPTGDGSAGTPVQR
jgi:hypothetical protein